MILLLVCLSCRNDLCESQDCWQSYCCHLSRVCQWEWSLTDTLGLVSIILLMVSSWNAPCLKRASLITTCCNVAQLLRLVNWQTLPASVKMVLFTWSHCRFNYCPGLAFQGVGVFCDILKPCCVVFYEYAMVVFVFWLLLTYIRCFLSVSSLAKLIVAQS